MAVVAARAFGSGTGRIPTLLSIFPRRQHITVANGLRRPPPLRKREMTSSASSDGVGEKITAPYGSWSSPITADIVSGADKRLGGFAVAGDGRLLWIETRPDEAGRAVLVKEPGKLEDKPVDVIPADFAARTLAQEYGGGAFAVSGNTIIFSNYKDQRLYKQLIGGC